MTDHDQPNQQRVQTFLEWQQSPIQGAIPKPLEASPIERSEGILGTPRLSPHITKKTMKTKKIQVPVVSYQTVALVVPADFDPSRLFEDENEAIADKFWEEAQRLEPDWSVDDEEFHKLYP